MLNRFGKVIRVVKIGDDNKKISKEYVGNELFSKLSHSEVIKSFSRIKVTNFHSIIDSIVSFCINLFFKRNSFFY